MKNHDDEIKFRKLEKIFNLFEQAVKKINPVCAEKCALCCTCNVTLTDLETRYLIRMLEPDQKKMALVRLKRFFPEKRYAPKISINRYASLCMEGKTAEDGENDPSWGQCPFLQNDSCTIYRARPLGCRVMVSQHNCKTHGYAQLPPVAHTLQTVFLQAVEHLDQNGVTGNLSDMLERQLLNKNDDSIFAQNQENPGFMVPPEHRLQIKGILNALSDAMMG